MMTEGHCHGPTPWPGGPVPRSAARVRVRDRFAVRAMQALAAPMLRVDRRLRVSGEAVDVTTMTVPTRHGVVQCRVYRARAHPSETPRPVHLQIHGGGFLVRTPQQDDHLNRHLAAATGAVVVSPDYDVAPRVQFPVAEEQCHGVAEWLIDEDEGHEWETGRLSIGGTSSGGKLAVNVAQLLHAVDPGRVRSLQLNCALVDVTRSDRTSPTKRPAVGRGIQRLMLDTYFADATTRHHPLASPVLDPMLTLLLPPTLIITAGDDSLAPEMDALAGALTDARRPVTHHRFAEVDHAFTHSMPAAPAHAAIRLMGEHIVAHVR